MTPKRATPPPGLKGRGPTPPAAPKRSNLVVIAVATGIVLLIAIAKLTLDASAPLPTGSEPASVSPGHATKHAKPAPRPAPVRHDGGEILSG